MNDILAKAEELGKAVASTEQYRAVSAARTAVEQNALVQADMKALDDLAARLARAQSQGKPIEPEDKRRLRDLQEKVTGHPTMRQLARAEADFSELMNRVSHTLRSQLEPPETEEGGPPPVISNQ